MKVFKILNVLGALFFLGCGADSKLAGPSDEVGKVGDWIGSTANDGRSYMSDRGFSSEDTQNGYNDAEADVGQQANDGRKHMSDRNISSGDAAQGYVDARSDVGQQANDGREHMSDRGASSENADEQYTHAKNETAEQYVEGKDHTGKKANESRDYLFDRGIDEMRNGDNDAQEKIDRTETRLDDAEARLVAIEAVNKQQDRLINILFSLSSSESLARLNADSAAADALAAEITARTNADDSEAVTRAKADADAAASFSSQLSETSAYFQGVSDAMQGELNDLSSQLNDQGVEITDIKGRLDAIEPSLDAVETLAAQLKDNVKKLKKKVKKLKNKVSDLEDDVSDLQDTACYADGTTPVSVSFSDKYDRTCSWWGGNCSYNTANTTISLNVPKVTCPSQNN